MDNSSALRRFSKRAENFIDDMVYGKDENIIERNARQQAFEKKYGNVFITAIMPVWYNYVNIRDVVKDPELTKGERFFLCTKYVGVEVAMDVVRVSGVLCMYGAFELGKNIASH